jgi:plastocyanin
MAHDRPDVAGGTERGGTIHVITRSGGSITASIGRRQPVPRPFVIASVMALLAAGIGAPTSVMAQEPLTVTAGVGDGTVAGQAFGPGDFSVSVGDSVTFTIGSDEPHTVTFGRVRPTSLRPSGPSLASRTERRGRTPRPLRPGHRHL